MARSLRSLQGLLRSAAQGEVGSASQLQQRFASTNVNYAESNGKFTLGIFSKKKPLDRSNQWVHKNPYIEAWYYRRDHLEREFVWNFRNTVEAIWLLGGFTFGFYYLSKFCMRQSDRRSGYTKRQVLGDEAGMVLPDEREFY